MLVLETQFNVPVEEADEVEDVGKADVVEEVEVIEAEVVELEVELELEVEVELIEYESLVVIGTYKVVV